MSKGLLGAALAASLTGTLAGPVLAQPTPPPRFVLATPMPAIGPIAVKARPYVSAKKRAWFRRAVERILTGELAGR